MQEGYEKVADAILELIRLRVVPEESGELKQLSMSYNRFRDKSDILKMLVKSNEPKSESVGSTHG